MSTKVELTKVSEEEKLTRGQRLWRKACETRPVKFSLERVKLLTASYKETEGLPTPIRRAKAFEKILNELPIFIPDEQLLVGDFVSSPSAQEWYAEHHAEDILRQIEEGQAQLEVDPEDMPAIREIYDYWKDRAVRDSFYRYVGEENHKWLRGLGEEGAGILNIRTELGDGKGWSVPDFPKAIRKGFSGILAEVEEELEPTFLSDEASFYKINFLKALAIMLKAGIHYSHRLAALAREMARTAEEKRKAELEKIAEICDWVPENPARTFWEALQTMWICFVFIRLDTHSFGISPGRVDQYLYPYYKKDIEDGILTREEAIELLECYRVCMTAKRGHMPADEVLLKKGRPGFGQANMEFLNCTLGGQTPDGKDATNELSYLWLEAAGRTRTPHPTLSVRVHENMNEDFAMKAAELCREGLGYPAWFGDDTSIQYLLDMGATLEEARDYALSGCLLHVVPNKTGSMFPHFISMPKVLEITLHNGLDPRLNKEVGPKTGAFESFKTYEELYEAYKKQVWYFLNLGCDHLRRVRIWLSDKTPQLFNSCLYDDCIKRGQNVLGGGAHYRGTSMYFISIAVADVADSLAAIKKYIYEEKLITKKQLMDALAANFEGEENQKIRRLLLAAPKYGNDDDYVDDIFVDIYDWLTKMAGEIDALFGEKWVHAPHNLTAHGTMGRKVGALPSGRLAGLAIAEGAVSPCQGVDHSGPTAVIKSAGKVDHTPMFGTLFNMKFSPSALKTKDDLKKFLALIKTYLIDYGGKHIQFNVVSKETLLDAQAHPENYKSLLVRVAGFSALWIELDRTLQDEIITRTEHSF